MLKLYITESNYVTEAIDDIKKYYPNIPDDVFMQLIALDPTYRGNDSAGKYGKWLLNLYNKGRLSQDEFNEVPDLLNQFTTYRNRIANKDLNSYKSLDDLSNVLASVIDDDSMLTDRQKVRFLKNVKSGKVKVSAEDDYDIVLDTPKFIVYVPNTHEASMKLGKGTKWCTAHENPDWYNQYTENGGKLYIIKDKNTGERWQYSDSTNDFLDEYDEDFNVVELLLQDEKLSKLFKKFIGTDIFNFDGTWIYNGKKILNNLKPNITKIIIDNSVTVIRTSAFANCPNLTSVIIPNSVTRIESLAFANCPNLTSVVIPDSVNYIGLGIFMGSTNVTIYTNNSYVIHFCKNIPIKPLNNNESINKNKRYKLHIKETYELRESNKPNVFNNNSRETYGDLINPNSKVGNVTTHDYYKFEKGKDAILTYMTADEYIDKCINKVFKSNYAKTVTNAVDWDKVDEYAELMKQGTKFPTPYLDYVNAGQEGRHRALAFKQAFGEDAEMPVIELYPSNPTLDEIYDYCTQKWRNGEQWLEYVAPNFGYTTKEIYDYLGKEYIEPVEDEEDEEDIINDTDVDFEISDEDILDDEYEMDAFEEFVREQSNGKIQNISDLDVDEFMKWMDKFTRYYSR